MERVSGADLREVVAVADAAVVQQGDPGLALELAGKHVDPLVPALGGWPMVQVALCALLAAAAGVPNSLMMWLVFLFLIFLAAFAYAAVFALMTDFCRSMIWIPPRSV